MKSPGRHAERRAARRSGTCGWPRILHGGVTAAAADEAFGFLLLSLRRAGELPFLAPAFTARLEVSYHKARPRRVRLPALGRFVLRPDASGHKVRRRARPRASAGGALDVPGCQRPQGTAPAVPLSLLEPCDAWRAGGLLCRVLWTLWHRRVVMPPKLAVDRCIRVGCVSLAESRGK